MVGRDLLMFWVCGLVWHRVLGMVCLMCIDLVIFGVFASVGVLWVPFLRFGLGRDGVLCLVVFGFVFVGVLGLWILAFLRVIWWFCGLWYLLIGFADCFCFVWVV